MSDLNTHQIDHNIQAAYFRALFNFTFFTDEGQTKFGRIGFEFTKKRADGQEIIEIPIAAFHPEMPIGVFCKEHEYFFNDQGGRFNVVIKTNTVLNVGDDMRTPKKLYLRDVKLMRTTTIKNLFELGQHQHQIAPKSEKSTDNAQDPLIEDATTVEETTIRDIEYRGTLYTVTQLEDGEFEVKNKLTLKAIKPSPVKKGILKRYRELENKG